jgi:hypothetical protein
VKDVERGGMVVELSECGEEEDEEAALRAKEQEDFESNVSVHNFQIEVRRFLEIARLFGCAVSLIKFEH